MLRGRETIAEQQKIRDYTSLSGINSKKMKYKKTKETFIKLKEFPPDHSISAFEKGFYFEAITVLHGYIESEMKSYFHLNSVKNSEVELSIAWDVKEKLSFISLTHLLFVLNLINKNEHDILVSFNTLRNELIHRYYLNLYDESYKGISKNKYTSIYKQTLKLVYLISERADELV